MGLSTGKNTIKLLVIDDSDGEVKFRAEWLDLNYEQTVGLQEAISNVTIGLGRAVIDSKGSLKNSQN